MPKTATPAAAPKIDSFDSVTARAGVRDRTAITRYLDGREGGSTGGAGTLWQRLIATLGTFAPLPFTTAMSGAVVLFSRPDGKYRMQVFSIEADASTPVVHVYLPDVIDEATKRGLIKPA